MDPSRKGNHCLSGSPSTLQSVGDGSNNRRVQAEMPVPVKSQSMTFRLV